MTDTEQLLSVDAAAQLLCISADELREAVRRKFISAASKDPLRFKPAALLVGFPKWVSRGRSAQECAQWLGISSRAFQSHLASGSITRQQGNSYNLQNVTAQYGEALRAAAQGNGGGSELMAARAEKERMLSERLRSEMAVERGELIPASHKRDLMAAHALGVRERIDTLAGRICHRLGLDPCRSDEVAVIDEECRKLWGEIVAFQDLITQSDVPAIAIGYRAATAWYFLDKGSRELIRKVPSAAPLFKAAKDAMIALLQSTRPQFLKAHGIISDDVVADIERADRMTARTFTPIPALQVKPDPRSGGSNA